MWLRRDEDGNLKLYLNIPWDEERYSGTELCSLPMNLYPEVTLENSPVEIELKIKENDSSEITDTFE